MRKLKCFLASSIVILFVGCSGKVQTDPLPDVRKYHFPGNSKEKELNTTLNEYGLMWNEFLREFFIKNSSDISKNIWQIGLERKHYEH